MFRREKFIEDSRVPQSYSELRRQARISRWWVIERHVSEAVSPLGGKHFVHVRKHEYDINADIVAGWPKFEHDPFAGATPTSRTSRKFDIISFDCSLLPTHATPKPKKPRR